MTRDTFKAKGDPSHDLKMTIFALRDVIDREREKSRQLADALRAVSGAPGNPCNCLDGDIHGDCDHCKAREALAAYDEEQQS